MKIITKDGFVLDAVFNTIKGSIAGVVLAHGITVDKDEGGIFIRIEKRLNDLGLTTLRFDFRGHGKSSGNSADDFTISGELIDLETAINFLEKHGIKKLGLIGASFGGGISALFIGKYPEKIKALLLLNPCLDYEKCFLNPTTPWAKKHFQKALERLKKNSYTKIGSRQFPVGRKLFKEMKQYFPYKRLNQYKGQLLIVHGDKDSKVDYQDTVKIYDNLDNPYKKLITIKGSEHGFHGEPYESKVVTIIEKFFIDTLKNS